MATRRHHHRPDLEVLVEEVVEVVAEVCPFLLQLPVQFRVPVVDHPLRVHRIHQTLLRLYSPVPLSGLMTPSTATLINLLLHGQTAHYFCYLHFAEREQDFPMDDNKILFTLSYLWGTTQKWFEPNLYDPTPGAVPAWDRNFLLFVKELTDNFGPQDPVGDAKDAIRQCRMKSSDRITTYIVAFDHLAAITGWGDRALRHQFYEGLPNRIKDEMVHHTYINNLPGNKEVARRIDARYWQRESEKQRERARHPPGNPGAGQGTGGSGNPSGSNRGNKGPSGKSTSQPNLSGQKGSGKASGEESQTVRR
ncbi:Retrotransposon nucleocapsid protein [Mycena venus]|uniref:Retrotransposon nucleocapsid protein n=1 Tax=Mycena venus TaxID=2733690 RepID=A0A8H7D8R6_9AGAR|nr:Retrotransposon nucleocapsid protein [Mycena venus]